MNLLDLIPGQLTKASVAKGGEYHGPCPLPACGGMGDDRFHVWPAQGSHGTFWCRICGAAGDAIEFLRLRDSLGYREACEQLGIEARRIDAGGPRPAPAVRTFVAASPGLPPQRWREKAGAFVEWCHAALLETPEQLVWLEARGIDRDLVQDYRLGFNPRDTWRERPAWGLEPEQKPDGKNKKLWLPAGLVIPLLDPAGRVLRLRIRRPDPGDGPRYYVVPGSSRQPLVSRRAEAYVIVESELDAILLDGAAGDLAGMVALGNDAAKPTEPLYGWLREALHISVSLDSDQPRVNGATGRREIPGAKASRWWLQQFETAERVPMVGGKDPGEMYGAGVSLRTWVLAGLPPRFHVADRLRRERLAAVAAGQPVPEAVAQEAGSTVDDELHLEVDLPDGSTMHVTNSRRVRAELVAAGEAVFSEAELDVLRSALAGMNEDERQRAVQSVAEIKAVFSEAVVSQGRKEAAPAAA